MKDAKFIKKSLDLNPAQQEAVDTLKKWFLAAGLAGGGLRSGMGLMDMANRNISGGVKIPRPLIVNVPYKYNKKEDPIIKGAEDEDKGLLNVLKSTFLAGSGAKDQSGVPWFPTAMLFGTPLAAYGGYKGVDALLRAKKQKDIESELEDTKADYQRALLQQINPRQKLASAFIDRDNPSLLKAEEHLDNHIKQADGAWYDWANPLAWTKQMGGQATGLYMALAASLGLPAAAMGYNYARSVDPEYQKAKALKSQIESRSIESPTPVYAKLTPVDERGRKIKTNMLNGTISPEENDLEKKAKAFVNKLFNIK